MLGIIRGIALEWTVVAGVGGLRSAPGAIGGGIASSFLHSEHISCPHVVPSVSTLVQAGVFTTK